MDDNSSEIVSILKGISLQLSNSADSGANELTYGVIVAVVGALSAYFFNLFHWRVTKRVEEKERHAENLISLLDSFQDSAVSYWLLETPDPSQSVESAKFIQELQKHSISVKTGIRLLIKRIDLYEGLLSKNTKSLFRASMSDFENEVFEEATGGDFESMNRVKDVERASRIAFLCTNAKIELTKSI